MNKAWHQVYNWVSVTAIILATAWLLAAVLTGSSSLAPLFGGRSPRRSPRVGHRRKLSRPNEVAAMPVKGFSTVFPIGLIFFVVAGCASTPHPPAQRAGAGRHRHPRPRRAPRRAGGGQTLPLRGGQSIDRLRLQRPGAVELRAGRAEVPRGTDDQRVAAQRIRVSELGPGDLIFFDQEGRSTATSASTSATANRARALLGQARAETGSTRPYWSKHISEARRLNV